VPGTFKASILPPRCASFRPSAAESHIEIRAEAADLTDQHGWAARKHMLQAAKANKA
jgi:hypothetical protein